MHDRSESQSDQGAPERFREVADLFLRLRDLPGRQRDAELRLVSTRDPDLANQVDLMLAASESGDGGPDEFRVAVDPGLRSGVQPSNPPGFEILGRIGTGSAGDVYLARQTGTIERRVAMKVLSFGTEARGFAERFESERKTIASMEHRGIASVFDAGTLPDGRPFFTMEYLEGGPITTFADRHLLGIDERIELFRAVCDAVQHAHQRGVLHLDLKPSNILMDGARRDAQPRVIDFGIAVAMSRRERPGSDEPFDHAGVGSPAYMSPECGARSTSAIDTRSDVFALGVLLSELLSGVRTSVEATAWPSPNRVREEDAASRGLSHKSLVSRLRGDLEAIVQKSTRVDPDERYASPRELAEDLRLHLEGLPVSARTPSALYVARSFVSRHRWPVAGGAFAMLSAITLIAILIWGSIAVRLERDQAVVARMEAQKSATTAEALSRALSSMVAGIQPSEARGRDTSLLRELVERSLADAEERLESEPLALARLRVTLGRGLNRLGEYERADEPIGSAIEILDSVQAEEEAAFARLELALIKLRSNHIDEAEHLAEQAMATSLRFPENARLKLLATLRTFQVLGDRGDYGAVREQMLVLEPFIRSSFSSDDQDVLALQVLRATADLELGYANEATALLEQILPTLDRVLGADHPQSIRSRGALAQAYTLQGRHEEALRSATLAVQAAREVLGVMHPDTLLLSGSLANALRDNGRTDQAVNLYRELIEQRRSVFGPDSPNVTVALNNYGALLRDMGRYTAAAEVFLEASSGMEAVHGPSHPHTLVMVSNYADMLTRIGDVDRALPLHDRVVGGLGARFPEGHWWTGSALVRRAEAYIALGEPQRAHADLLEARDCLDPSIGPGRDLLPRIDELLELTTRAMDAGDS